MVRFLFISDFHVDSNDKPFKLAWLKSVVQMYEPDLILSAGDNGDLSVDDIEELGVDFYTIYGNHDSPALTISDFQLYKHWLRDGLIVLNNGLRILAWNGIFGFRTDRKRKWFHRSLDDAVRLAFKYMNNRPHVFISHEVPYYRYKDITTQEYLAVMNYIVRMTKPLVWLNGHMHLNQDVQIDKKTFKPTIYIRVESYRRGYAVVDIDTEADRVQLIYPVSDKKLF